MLLLLSLIGCSPSRFEDCDDAPCREATVAAAWERSPAVVKRFLTEADPFEQATLIELVAHADPSAQSVLCASVATGSPAEDRCQKMMLRPHLYEKGKNKSTNDDTPRPAGGPGQPTPPSSRRSPPWSRGELRDRPMPAECTGAGRAACLSDQVAPIAEKGDPATALGACFNAWPAGSATEEECVFRAAETYARAARGPGLRDAISMCTFAGTLAGNCTQHVLLEGRPTAAPADRPDKQRVEAAIETARALAEGEDKRVAEILTGLYWATWTESAFDRASRTTGHLLAALPPEAAPHVRMAAAYHLLADEGLPVSVDAGAIALREALAITGPLEDDPNATTTSGKIRVNESQGRAYWSQDLGREDQIPALWCMGRGRRTTAESPDDELRIVILEAAARQDPTPSASFFSALLGSEQADTVRWTAARLLAETYPNQASPLASIDPLPLVRDAIRVRGLTTGTHP